MASAHFPRPCQDMVYTKASLFISKERGRGRGRERGREREMKAERQENSNSNSEEERKRDSDSPSISPLQLIMDSTFWGVNISSPKTLTGLVHSVPGEAIPALPYPTTQTHPTRLQHLAVLRHGFPYRVIPSLSPALVGDDGSLCLQRLLLGYGASHWFGGLIGQLRLMSLDGDVIRNIFRTSPYSFGVCAGFAPSDSSSIIFDAEQRDAESHRSRVKFCRKVADHDVMFEVARQQLYIDSTGSYWDVPSSICFDVSSRVSRSGWRYRLGLLDSDGLPRLVSARDGERAPAAPLALMPGACAKLGLSYEKSVVWRQEEEDEEQSNPDRFSFDTRLSWPHTSLSCIMGFVYTFGGRQPGPNVVGSIAYSYQEGRFRELRGDFTRADARLDISSLVSPKINLAFQKQIIGPILFRLDSRFSPLAHMEDAAVGVSYSLWKLQSSKVLFWYRPRRREAMIELRMFEF